jgi:GNAT superfamily N-acetyltransferase
MKRTEAKQHRGDDDVYPAQGGASFNIFQIRRGTAQDADIISWHRARMFQDMGDVSGDAFEILRRKARTRLEQWINNGRYVAWLASPVNRPEMIVAGAGIQLQPILPRPLDVSTIGEGRQGTIVNVFTEPQWRRRGIAALLLKEIIIWCKDEKVDRLVLHASDEGRSIYERLGFIISNEMRFVGDS